MTRLPDQLDAPMTPRQLATLRTLSAEAYQPKLFERDLTAREAERRGEFVLNGGLRAGDVKSRYPDRGFAVSHSSTICPPSYPQATRPSAARNCSVSTVDASAAKSSGFAIRRARASSDVMRPASR